MLREFEEELIAYWKSISKAVHTQPRTSLWIRGHLEDLGEDYCYGAWKRYKDFVLQAEGYGIHLRMPEADSFRLLWWHLEKFSLIELSRVERSAINPTQTRHYYRLKETNLRLWENPRAIPRKVLAKLQ